MSGTVPALDRRRVLAHRFAAHGLVVRTAADPADLRVLRLGVQDTPPGSLPLALAARLSEVPGLGPAVATTYLALFAPASAADVAGFLGTSATAVRPALPDDLVRVTVAGRSAHCPPALVDALAGPAPEPAGAVRLLPPSDPYLQGRDRELLVPAKEQRSVIWRAVGGPGVVAVDGEVAGVWRTRVRGRVLEITVEAFRPLSGPEAGAVAAEAERVRQVRGAGEVVVRTR